MILLVIENIGNPLSLVAISDCCRPIRSSETCSFFLFQQEITTGYCTSLCPYILGSRGSAIQNFVVGVGRVRHKSGPQSDAGRDGHDNRGRCGWYPGCSRIPSCSRTTAKDCLAGSAVLSSRGRLLRAAAFLSRLNIKRVSPPLLRVGLCIMFTFPHLIGAAFSFFSHTWNSKLNLKWIACRLIIGLVYDSRTQGYLLFYPKPPLKRLTCKGSKQELSSSASLFISWNHIPQLVYQYATPCNLEKLVIQMDTSHCHNFVFFSSNCKSRRLHPRGHSSLVQDKFKLLRSRNKNNYRT